MKQMIGAAPRRQRRTRAGVVLSRQLIIDTALRLLAEHGREGLSARRLAAALDIDPSTLYRYFRSMDDVTLAVGDALIARALNGWEPQGDWVQDLRTLCLRIHRAYLDHPQAAMLTASRISGLPHELASDEAILSLLLRAGFSRSAAVRIYQIVIDQCLAFAALDAAEAALPPSSRQADDAMWATTYAHLPAATHPAIAATAELLTVQMRTSAYPGALEMVLTTARAELSRTVPPQGTQGGPVDTGGPAADPSRHDSFLLVDETSSTALEGLVEQLVPQDLWLLFRRVVRPTGVARPQGGGRRRAGDRETFAAIVFVATSGCTWRQLPPDLGPSWQTVYRRFAQWHRADVWTRLQRVVRDARGEQREPDWCRRAVDAVVERATRSGPDTRA